MKATALIYLLFVHAFVGIALAKTDILSYFQMKLGYEVSTNELTLHYLTMIKFHKSTNKNIPDNSIIFIGDSITQGFAVTAVSSKSINLGIGQDTTIGVNNKTKELNVSLNQIRKKKLTTTLC